MGQETKFRIAPVTSASRHFDDGEDVVSLPEEASCAGAFEFPTRLELDAVGAAGALEIEVGGAGVDGAEDANAFVAGEDLRDSSIASTVKVT